MLIIRIEYLVCYKELVTFARLELLSFLLAQDTRIVPNNPELIFNCPDYFQLLQASQSDLWFPAGCVHTF